jgi:hypothetical protein
VTEYLLKVVTEGQEDEDPLHEELFEARSDDAAARQALRLLRPHVRDPRAQYGRLLVIDGPQAGAFTRYSYLADVEAGT